MSAVGRRGGGGGGGGGVRGVEFEPKLERSKSWWLSNNQR